MLRLKLDGRLLGDAGFAVCTASEGGSCDPFLDKIDGFVICLIDLKVPESDITELQGIFCTCS